MWAWSLIDLILVISPISVNAKGPSWGRPGLDLERGPLVIIAAEASWKIPHHPSSQHLSVVSIVLYPWGIRNSCRRFATWSDTDEYEPPITPLTGPVVLTFSLGMPPSGHSYLRDRTRIRKFAHLDFFVFLSSFLNLPAIRPKEAGRKCFWLELHETHKEVNMPQWSQQYHFESKLTRTPYVYKGNEEISNLVSDLTSNDVCSKKFAAPNWVWPNWVCPSNGGVRVVI